MPVFANILKRFLATSEREEIVKVGHCRCILRARVNLGMRNGGERAWVSPGLTWPRIQVASGDPQTRSLPKSRLAVIATRARLTETSQIQNLALDPLLSHLSIVQFCPHMHSIGIQGLLDMVGDYRGRQVAVCDSRLMALGRRVLRCPDLVRPYELVTAHWHDAETSWYGATIVSTDIST